MRTKIKIFTLSRFIFLLGFFIFSTLVNSQESDTLKPRLFDVGFSYSFENSYRKLKASSDQEWIKNIYDTTEIPKFGYTLGINFVYHLHKKICLSSGIFIADKGEKTKEYAIQPAVNYKSHYYYCELPLKVAYKLFSKKMQCSLSAGLATGYFLVGKLVTQINTDGSEKVIRNPVEAAKVSCSFITGLSVDMKLTTNSYFKIEPNYRRSFTSMSLDPVKKYFYSFGISLGIYTKF